MKIAIVTFEFEGLTKGGGIGSAYRRMAELLTGHGHKVTAVVVPFGWDETFLREKKNAASEISTLKRAGIDVAIVGVQSPPEMLNASYHLRRSLSVYHFLRDKDFDIVHYSDNCGLTYHSLLARRSNLDFKKTKFVVGTHGSPLWTNEANRVFFSEAIVLSQLDRYCVEYSDYLVSPSHYMFAFLKKSGWRIPNNALVIPNVNDLNEKPSRPSKQALSSTLSKRTKTLVFFGRLELRKGILLFVGALEKLLDIDPSIGSTKRLEVIFLGRQEPADNGMTDMIRQKLHRFGSRLDLQFISNLQAKESLEFLCQDSNRLICMPSLLENSPYVVTEATELGLDFISTDSGGQGELIDPTDRAKVLVSPTAEALYFAIRKRLRSGAIRAKASRLAIEANQKWLSFHEKLKKEIRTNNPRPSSLKKASISIVLDALRPSEMSKALANIAAQDLSPHEILVPVGTVLDKRPLKRLKIRFFNVSAESPRWLSAARFATGKYLLFLREGELFDKSTLRKSAAAADCWLKQDSLCLAVSGIIVGRALDGSRKDHFFLTRPADPLLCIKGRNPANIFAVWNRTLFLRQAERFGVDLSNERSMAPFLSRALACGHSFGSMPIPVVRANGYNPNLRTNMDQLSLIEAFIDTPPKDWTRWVYYLAGLERQVTGLQQETFDLRRKVDILSKAFQSGRSAQGEGNQLI